MKRSRSLTGLVFAVVFFAASQATLLFFMAELASGKTFAEEAAQRIATAEAQFASARSFARLHAETALAREEASVLLVEEEDITPFLEQIESLASRSGVALEIGSADLKKGESPTLSLLLRYSGSFSEVHHFLALIETLPHAASVDTVYLEHVRETWSGSLRLSVAARVNEPRVN